VKNTVHLPCRYMLILDVHCFLVLEPDSLFVVNIFPNSLTLKDNAHYKLIFSLGKKVYSRKEHTKSKIAKFGCEML
jgi:hypothetical protein